MNFSRKKHARRGLTAIEVLVVLAIFVVVLLIAWPRLQTWRDTMLAAKLREALDTGNRDATLRLLKKGASPDAWSGSTPHFCLRGQTVQQNDLDVAQIIFPKAEPGSPDVTHHNPPLLNIAVANDSPAMVRILVDAGADLAHEVQYAYATRSHIMTLAREGYPDVYALVRHYEIPGNTQSYYTNMYVQPLHGGNDDFTTVARVFSITRLKAMDVSSIEDKWKREDYYVNSFLHDAVYLDSPELLRCMLDLGVVLDLRDERGETARQLAARLERQVLVDILTEAESKVGPAK